MSGHQKIIALQLICTNTNCFYKIIFAKLLALNVLTIALYIFKNFNNIYMYLSCHALKIKSTQIIFKQEMHSNIILTLTIHKQTSLNFDDKKYIISQWLFVLEQYAEFGLLFVLQWEYFLQLLEKHSSFSISIILLL